MERMCVWMHWTRDNKICWSEWLIWATNTQMSLAFSTLIRCVSFSVICYRLWWVELLSITCSMSSPKGRHNDVQLNNISQTSKKYFFFSVSNTQNNIIIMKWKHTNQILPFRMLLLFILLSCSIAKPSFLIRQNVCLSFHRKRKKKVIQMKFTLRWTECLRSSTVPLEIENWNDKCELRNKKNW